MFKPPKLNELDEFTFVYSIIMFFTITALKSVLSEKALSIACYTKGLKLRQI